MKWENNKTTSQEKSWEEKEIPPKKSVREREKEKEKLINRQGSERKSLLHFLSGLSEERKAQKQSYSFGDLIVQAENKFSTLQGSAILPRTQERQFYPL